MTIVRTDDKHYKAIADTLREYGQGVQTFTPEEMPQGIINNCLGHYSQGRENGYASGYNEGLTVGFENGEKTQHDVLWNSIQDNGNRVIYNYAFTGAWTREAFKPQYDMKPTHAYRMFWNCQINDDLVEILKECGVELDFSNTGAENNYIFTNSLFTRVGVINTTSMSSVSQAFMNAKELVTIDKLILKEDGTQNFVSPFTGTGQLENITIEGKIGQALAINYCTKLTHTSLMSFINALYDYSGTSTTKTLTVGTENLAKLTDIEKAIATQKGWTLA